VSVIAARDHVAQVPVLRLDHLVGGLTLVGVGARSAVLLAGHCFHCCVLCSSCSFDLLTHAGEQM
jgi:hypothetical protein